MDDKKLMLLYISSSQKNTPPMAIIGRLDYEDDRTLRLICPLSADSAYFSLVGVRLKQMTDPREFELAKADKSLRTLPQLSPADFNMMSVGSCAEYVNLIINIYKEQVIYSLYVSDDSCFYKAYNIMSDLLSTDSALSQYYNESLFNFDVEHYLNKLSNPETVKDVLIPVSIDTQRRS